MLHIAVGANTHSINNGASGQTGKVLPVMMILAKEKKIRQDSQPHPKRGEGRGRGGSGGAREGTQDGWTSRGGDEWRRTAQNGEPNKSLALVQFQL